MKKHKPRKCPACKKKFVPTSMEDRYCSVACVRDATTESNPDQDALIQSALPLAYKIAIQLYRFGSLWRSGSLDDALQEAALVVVRAARTYDPTKSSFTTHVTHCVSNKLKNHGLIHHIIHIPNYALCEEMRGKPVKDEVKEAVSVALDLSVSTDVMEWSLARTGTHVDTDENNWENQYRMFLDALPFVKPRELDVITALYGIGRKQEKAPEIGVRLGVSRERVRQIKDKGFKTIRKVVRTKLQVRGDEYV